MQRLLRLLTIAGLLAFAGCGSGQMISEASIDEQLARLKVGQTTRSEVESALGTHRGNDDKRWLFQLSDSAFNVGANQRKGLGGLLPVTAGVSPNNTRAIVAASFDDAGILSRLEVERFFAQPFTNDYWFQVKDPLRSFAGIAESLGYKVVALDHDTGTFRLEDSTANATIGVILQARILRLTSKNPHDRLAGEYRAHRKREGLIISRIADSGLIQ